MPEQTSAGHLLAGETPPSESSLGPPSWRGRCQVQYFPWDIPYNMVRRNNPRRKRGGDYRVGRRLGRHSLTMKTDHQ